MLLVEKMLPIGRYQMRCVNIVAVFARKKHQILFHRIKSYPNVLDLHRLSSRILLTGKPVADLIIQLNTIAGNYPEIVYHLLTHYQESLAGGGIIM